MINPKSESRFRRFGILTIASVYFLILVGGLVRSTGSGMGCPDWPKCFGQWIPPTDISELPTDYKEQFKVSNHEIADFDVFKTWTEYINRLIGVLIGLFILLTVFFSIPYLKVDKPVFFLCFVAFVLVGFQGWIGSIVVSTNLSHWMITIHMLIALLIVGILIYAVTRSQQFVIKQHTQQKWLRPMTMGLLILGVFQTISGTQIREAVDIMDKLTEGTNRSLWIEGIVSNTLTQAYDFSNYGLVFLIHRSASLIQVLFIIGLMMICKRIFDRGSIMYKTTLAVLLLVSIQVFTGKILEVMGLPRLVQSAHLFFGSILMGGYLYLTILVYTKVKL